ncbi:SDR family NAD(P)-dependent oxidoreductase [Amycolatopsis magusensis]|uniref:SDR family NAD(P)-dependent oxidoreductase n=1 Tax=Amycolatopsis magusensis TaxID=882444 RepID=UPI0024A95AD3|nr:SDR family NAD(P)-dependent oxidoreductase [Amycolatopsis magusensis]MDI5979860.1 SDR family NAD(P)-dependent oxidoreductase [Amycolatopsis magusensis]
MAPDSANRAMAVVGLGAVAPGANSPAEVWQVLCGDVPQFRGPVRFDPEPIRSADLHAEDRTFGRAAGYIDRFAPHPVLAAEIERGQWEEVNSEQLWLRHALLQALDTATPEPGQRAGCYVATWTGAGVAAEDTVLTSYLARHMSRELARDQVARSAWEHRLRSLLRSRYRHARTPRLVSPDMVIHRAMAGLLPEDTDWLTVSAACASSLYAIDLGIASLLAGDCDIAYCGSVNGAGRLLSVSAAKFQGLSLSGEVRAFDEDADGTLFSEAATMIAVKRYDQAVSDGDRVLAVICGSALATDGRGKAISAPHSAGLRRAIDLAWADGGVTATDVSWVIAHGTGTAAGDEVEIETLAAVADGAGLWCTSNKPLFGHAAWAAGGLSVIHAVKALEHGLIPAQRRFTAPHPKLAGTAVQVPREPLRWPAGPTARVVGVTGMGVGGVNAHLVIRDRTPEPSPGRPPTTPVDGAVVLAAWSAWLPGEPEPGAIRHWLATGDTPPEYGFGDRYPAPVFLASRLPPVVTEVIDRSHLMALDVAHRFVGEHGELWEGLRDRTGVLAAHCGPTRSWVDATLRAAAGDLETVRWNEEEQAAFDAVLTGVRTRQRITDETLAGSVPSLAACRIAHRWDLHGPTMSFDTGTTSALTAVHAALRYLRQKRLDLALVLAFNEGHTAEAADFTARRHSRLAEGAFLLAFARAETAEDCGWRPQAQVTATVLPGAQGAVESIGDHDYLGAQGAVDLLRRVVRQERADLISDSPRVQVSAIPIAPVVPDTSEKSARASRWTTTLRRNDLRPPEAEAPAIPPSCVVLVNSATLAAALADDVGAAGGLLVSTDPATRPDLAVVAGELTGTSAASLLGHIGARHHIRVFAEARRPIEQWCDPNPALDSLLELTLLMSQRCGDRLGRGSFAVTVLDPLTDLQVHPDSAALTGFTRGLGCELPSQQVCAVVTDATLDGALGELGREFSAPRDCPVAYYRGGERYTELICPAPLPEATDEAWMEVLGAEPVVVAIGGARGIAVTVLTDLARRHRPVLWLLGRSDLGSVPPDIAEASDGDQARLRAAFITHGATHTPRPPVGELNRAFEQHWRARESLRNLRELRALCGPDRVHYVQCDITDRAAAIRAADAVLARHQHIDLLVNSSFHQESALYTSKRLADFRRVIGTKIAGYRNLKAAFAAVPPRLWCNFGSSIALVGLPGETDYTAGSEYLAAAARYENRLFGTATVTINWGLWEDSGAAADEQTRRRLTAIGVRTGLSDAEGTACFRAELAAARSVEPAPTYLTGYDREITGHRFPALVAEPRTRAPDGLLGAPADTSPGHACWQWAVCAHRDRYLLEHLVDGKPVLPGMAIVAMAAEAAMWLHPGSSIRCLRDIRFEQFVWADPREPGPNKYRIVADTIEPGQTVRVQVLSDVVASTGQVLSRDRRHAVLDVALGRPDPPPPQPDPPPTSAARHTDPCCRSDSPIRLSGVFHNTVDIIAGHDRVHARCQSQLAPADAFTHAALPVLLLDALGRTCCYAIDSPGTMTVHVPAGIDRIDVYVPLSDNALAVRYPTGTSLHGDLSQDRYTAVAPDGTVIARISGLRRHPIATLDVDPLPSTTRS